MRFIRIVTDIELSGRWFLLGQEYEVVSMSRRLITCFGCGVVVRNTVEIHYHVLIDDVTYYIPSSYCAYFTKIDEEPVVNDGKGMVQRTNEDLVKDDIVADFGNDYVKMTKSLTNIDIAAKECDYQATMPRPNALEELMERKVGEGKYKRLPNPGIPNG